MVYTEKPHHDPFPSGESVPWLSVYSTAVKINALIFAINLNYLKKFNAINEVVFCFLSAAADVCDDVSRREDHPGLRWIKTRADF